MTDPRFIAHLTDKICDLTEDYENRLKKKDDIIQRFLKSFDCNLIECEYCNNFDVCFRGDIPKNYLECRYCGKYVCKYCYLTLRGEWVIQYKPIIHHLCKNCSQIDEAQKIEEELKSNK